MSAPRYGPAALALAGVLVVAPALAQSPPPVGASAPAASAPGAAGAADPAPPADAEADAEGPEPGLESEIEVATRTPLTTRDAPGVVTVIQREEIDRAGARDLLDILHLVPGFAFGVDVQGVVDVGFRGMWGHEGKVLFLLDGQELNETLYSTMQLGLHVPAAIIERVEVIRGPGSAIYGGYAELAVINIVTRDARTLRGPAGSLSYGQMNRTFGHVGASASFGGTFPKRKGVSLAVHLAYAEGTRSDRTYRDFAGRSFDMGADARLGDLLLDAGLGYRGLKLRLIYDDYRIASRDGLDRVLDAAAAQRFESIFAELRYEARLGSKITLAPRFSYKHQTPWQVTDKASPLFYDKSADRLLGGLQLNWNAHRLLDVIAGVEGFWDHGHVNDPTLTGLQTLFGGGLDVHYGNVAGYAQLLLRTFVANLTLGARYEYNTQFGHSFVPRVGVTRIIGRYNFKLLYSQAFRAPGLENVNLNRGILPERTNIVEAEAGVQITGHLAATANGYWLRIDHPIVYELDPATNSEKYLNAGHTGSSGVEVLLRLKYAWGFANLSYSFYSAAGQNAVAQYAVPGDDRVLLGFPAHKAALYSGWNLWRDHLTLGVSAIVLGPRQGYLSADPAGKPVIGTEPTTVLLQATLTYRNLGLRGLDLSAGAYNLLDQTYRVLQPYNGGHAPLPLGGREVMLRLAYGPPLD